VLEKDGGEIVHKITGQKIKIQKKGGVYVVRMWVPERKDPVAVRAASGFARPGRS